MEEKFVIKLNGGLGNQMFQWALARMIAETTGMVPYLDMSYFKNRYARPYQLDIFKVEPKFVEGQWDKFKLDVIWSFRAFLHWEKTFEYTLFSEKQFNFDRGIQKIKPNTYILGFFQSEKYFKNVEALVRDDFEFIDLASEENVKMIRQIKAGPSISLHIRRGDYVKKKRYQDAYATCSLDYYRRGVEHIVKSCPNPTLFIFSDDIEWVKANLKLPYKSVYVSHNKGKKSFEDMRLMSHCQHNIIANSSFSWWGAWLNKNENKIVIAPQKWFNDDKIIQTDVIPQEWVRIEN